MRTLGPDRAAELVGATPVFGPLEAADLRTLLQGSTTTAYAKREMVNWAGEARGYSFLILAGRVWLYRMSPEGKFSAVFEATSGDFIPTISPATYIDAAEDGTIVCRLVHRQYKEVRRCRPDVGDAVEETLARRLIEAFDRIEELTSGDVGTRLQSALSRREQRGGAPLTREELAALVGASRQQVTASLALLREAGVVEYEPHQRRGVTTRRAAQIIDPRKSVKVSSS